MSVKILITLNLILFHVIISKTLDNYDICKNSTGHRIYLEINDGGIFEAKNLISNIKNETYLTQECHLEIVTCPSCIISINFTSLNLSENCGQNVNFETECFCEFVQIYEHPYQELSSKKICGFTKNLPDFNFTTLTKNLNIHLVYFYDNDVAFTAEYKSIRNRIQLPKMEQKFLENILFSPFFPSYYLSDLSAEYIISCPNSSNKNCRIRIIFSDFQIAVMSIMEFFDGNGQRLDVVTGSHFRPPILVSNDASLIVRFYANGGTGLGYKAEYSFIYDTNELNITNDYHTDCGGFVDNLGGGITMMNMVKKGSKKFYCYWIIKSPKNYLHFKTYLYLKIANFSNMDEPSKIMVHKSSTSSGEVLEIIRHPNTDLYPLSPREHIQPIDTGFYVSFTGVFGVKSRLAIVYAAFSYKDCFSGTDFLCENHRCISRLLTCDGFDHCGDGSDETASCFQNPEPTDRRWYSKTPNYFFPKNDPYNDLKTATLIFIISSLGLISLVSALFVLLYRINIRARHERNLQNHLQIITDLLEEEILETESLPDDDPPVYEAPPDYDEVIKIECEASLSENLKQKKINKRKKRNKNKISNRSRINTTSEISGCSLNLQENNVVSPPEYNFFPPIFSSNAVKSRNHFHKNNPYIYLSDEAISSNIKQILKKKWHSQDELNSLKITDKSLNLKKFKRNSHEKMIFRMNDSRETASDSELLNIDYDDQSVVYKLNDGGKRVVEFFKKKNSCQCQGACGCLSNDLNQCFLKISGKSKKWSKKQNTKFYTR